MKCERILKLMSVANMHCSECKNLERLWHLNNALTVYYFVFRFCSFVRTVMREVLLVSSFKIWN